MSSEAVERVVKSMREAADSFIEERRGDRVGIWARKGRRLIYGVLSPSTRDPELVHTDVHLVDLPS